MNTENMIDVTSADLTKLVKGAYDLSSPQGLGFMHAKPGGLSDEDAAYIIAREGADSDIAASMDYVHGRACKMTVFRDKDTGKLFIPNNWYDHSDAALDELLERVGVSR